MILTLHSLFVIKCSSSLWSFGERESIEKRVICMYKHFICLYLKQRPQNKRSIFNNYKSICLSNYIIYILLLIWQYFVFYDYLLSELNRKKALLFSTLRSALMFSLMEFLHSAFNGFSFLVYFGLTHLKLPSQNINHQNNEY